MSERPHAPRAAPPYQPDGRSLGEALSIVHILVPRQSAVDRLPDQVGERELGIRAPNLPRTNGGAC